ncbi:UNVERIFIED_CONTAM: hypothetical protein Sindi_0471800 [Sesamum indicum]
MDSPTLTHGTLRDDGAVEDAGEATLGGEFHQGEDGIGFLTTVATDKNTPGDLGTDDNGVILAADEHHVLAVRILSPIGSNDVRSSFNIAEFLTLTNRIVDEEMLPP